MQIRVKICSIQEAEHALAAAEAGADYVGLNFVPGARRCLAEEKANLIVKAYRQQHGRGRPRLVGVFAGQPLEEVNRILDDCDLDMAQLSGNEPLDYCLAIGRPVIKAVHVPLGLPFQQVVSALDAVLGKLESANILPLLDPDVAGAHGGTGATFDWNIARELAPLHQFLLGGGLTTENVGQAVHDVGPWGVDVSSGVETKGIKDPEKIRAFVQQARDAERSR
ncbi:MAG: phosphoribosylanthranilate isomerase [Dehalococcoidia bacterium]|nr:phosphoribosylanthranilate isomerase [Dehalococcoidia bacterium]